jgi:hypothetical protein
MRLTITKDAISKMILVDRFWGLNFIRRIVFCNGLLGMILPFLAAIFKDNANRMKMVWGVKGYGFHKELDATVPKIPPCAVGHP